MPVSLMYAIFMAQTIIRYILNFNDHTSQSSNAGIQDNNIV